MKKVVVFLVLVLCLISGSACSSASSVRESTTGTTPASSDYSQGASNATPATTNSDRLVVQNADISLIVKDVTETRDTIVDLAAKYEGYVVSSNLYSRNLALTGSISIRVPEDNYVPALEEIRTLGVRITAERTYTEDVTEQYTDLQARLKNAQATEAQYIALLDRAEEVEDILKIQSYLSQVRQTIEQLQGQIKYLESTTSTALISVTLEPESSSQPLVQGEWDIKATVKSAARGFLKFGKFFVTVVIWIALFIPLWGIILAIVLLRKHHINPFRSLNNKIHGRSDSKNNK